MKLKRHHYENLVPLAFTLISIGIIYFYFGFRIYNYIGIGLMAVGLVLWWVGKLTLGDAWSVKAKAKKLVQKGIYSKVRHPIYYGFVLTLVGWAVFIPCLFWAVVSAVAIVVLIVRARKEEKVLLEKFGKKYLNYKKKTWF